MGQYKNQKGFTLTEIMVAVAIMGGFSLGIMQMTGGLSKLTSKSNIDSDLAQANAQIMTYFTTPNHCNANFSGLPVGSISPIAIYSCAASSCLGANNNTPPAKIMIPIVTGWTSVNDAKWTQSITGISTKIRIVGLSFTVSPVTVTAGTYPYALSTLRYSVTYQTRLDATALNYRVIVKDFFVSVVVNGPIGAQANKIVGCPKAWNSTVPYP